MMTTETPTTRAGFAALVGRPNVGKSTLLNTILDQKVAIVSHRPQTTRNRILGVRTRGNDQVVILDTPGIHRRRANINRFMVREAFDALDGADVVVLITEVDPKRIHASVGETSAKAVLHPADDYVVSQVRERSGNTPLILVINKIDLIRDRQGLLPLMSEWAERGFDRIVPISARHGEGVDLLFDELAASMPQGPLLYPEDMVTDRAERFLAAEMIREQVFVQCREEIPYATAVEIERFEERHDRGDVHIDATIYVERETQKAIVVGAKGARIKEIGTLARQEIARLLGCLTHVKLTVRVSTDWTRSVAARRRFGYE
ncbi:MAG: GTPase Era [Deltaproteobacteria bacterium]|nr:GTPase Era [Deltaproteobacteria bacterium]